MTGSIRRTAAFAMATILGTALTFVALMPGCASSGEGDSAGTATTEQTGVSNDELDYTEVSDLMGRLASADTVEQANALIGSEGEQQGEPDESSISTTTTYRWELPGDIGIDGRYTVYSEGYGGDSATYSVSYWPSKVGDRADFSRWDEIKAALRSDEGLSYDGMVELLGGVEGLRKQVSTKGETTYNWYNEDGNYLFTMVDSDGMCGTTSGYF